MSSRAVLPRDLAVQSHNAFMQGFISWLCSFAMLSYSAVLPCIRAVLLCYCEVLPQRQLWLSWCAVLLCSIVFRSYHVASPGCLAVLSNDMCHLAVWSHYIVLLGCFTIQASHAVLQCSFSMILIQNTKHVLIMYLVRFTLCVNANLLLSFVTLAINLCVMQ